MCQCRPVSRTHSFETLSSLNMGPSHSSTVSVSAEHRRMDEPSGSMQPGFELVSPLWLSRLGSSSVYRGYIGRMEKNMETTIFQYGYSFLDLRI